MSACGKLLAWALKAATSAANAPVVWEAKEKSCWAMGSKGGLVCTIGG